MAMIERLFGPRVASIVRECSDSESANPGQKLSRQQRKRAYLDHLQQASPDALLISAADKLHNARDILACYREMGRRVVAPLQSGCVEGRSLALLPCFGAELSGTSRGAPAVGG